jgi:hypothetical protein
MTDEELDQLTDTIAMALDEPSLTAWEKHFIEDMRSNVEKWGNSVRVSVKQQEVLRKIAEKCN